MKMQLSDVTSRRKVHSAPRKPLSFSALQLKTAVERVLRVRKSNPKIHEGSDKAWELYGELYLDEDGEAHFLCHTDGGMSFHDAREGLKRFIRLFQEQLERQKECPFYTKERS